MRVFLTTLTLALLGAACSPVSAGREISDAQGALAAAENAGAPRLAIYEYTAAVEYLHKAREENNHSDYDAARTYAAHARELAQEARSRADRQSAQAVKGGQDPTLDTAQADHHADSMEADEAPQGNDLDDPLKRSKGGKRK